MKHAPGKPISRALKAWLAKHRLTQHQAAEALGVPQSTLALWLSGQACRDYARVLAHTGGKADYRRQVCPFKAEMQAWRARFNLSQTEAAALLGVPVKTLKGWEIGRPPAKADDVRNSMAKAAIALANRAETQ
jgi:DNA-binding transcriptional regulator YiaG